MPTPTSPQAPDPEAATLAQERYVSRLVGNMPRQIAHVLRDALRAAWQAGYRYGKGEP